MLPKQKPPTRSQPIWSKQLKLPYLTTPFVFFVTHLLTVNTIHWSLKITTFFQDLFYLFFWILYNIVRKNNFLHAFVAFILTLPVDQPNQHESSEVARISLIFFVFFVCNIFLIQNNMIFWFFGYILLFIILEHDSCLCFFKWWFIELFFIINA